MNRLLCALVNSCQGLRAAFASEWAFRVEICLAPFILCIALLCGKSPTEKSLLVLSLFLVLLAELANTAIETVVNRISLERHPLSGKAKDIGSAIVFIALANAGVTWLLIFFG